jgi:hypothetical protein
MYRQSLKTAIVEGLRRVYDSEYPVEELRGVNVSIEFPVSNADMPCYWVNYEDDPDSLVVAGIGHQEVTYGDGQYTQHTRWRFQGTFTITAMAMSSRERDMMYDELIRVFAFGRYTEPTNQFRDLIENHDLIAMNVNFDSLRPSGDNAGMGTPWETSEMLYEISLSLTVIGEFVGDPITQVVVPLGEIRVHPYAEDLQPVPNPPADEGYDATAWL